MDPNVLIKPFVQCQLPVKMLIKKDGLTLLIRQQDQAVKVGFLTLFFYLFLRPVLLFHKQLPLVKVALDCWLLMSIEYLYDLLSDKLLQDFLDQLERC